MTGAELQLAAYGAQDIYLTGNPQISFFKIVFKKHTNFAIEQHKLEFEGNADFNNKVVCKVKHYGDLLSEIFLHIDLPVLTPKFIQIDNIHNKDSGIPFILGYDCDYFNNGNTMINKKYLNQHQIISWVNSIGHVIIDYVTIEIGGELIDKQYGEWLEIWDELTISKCKKQAYDQRMIGKYSDNEWLSKGIYENALSMSLDIPLRFWFCNNNGLALPLIALQQQDVKIYVKFNDFNNCWWNVKLDKSQKYKNKCNKLPFNYPEKKNIKNCYLLANYVYLDTDERRKYVYSSHEYLIEQIQYNDPINVSCTISDIFVDLEFNHPIKEIIWVLQNEKVKYFNDWYDYSTEERIQFENDNINLYACYNNYINKAVHPNNYMYINNSRSIISNEIDMSAVILDIKKNILNNSYLIDNNNEIFDMRCSPLNNAVLLLNGQERFPMQNSKHFDTIQPYLYHSCIPNKGNIYCYSFGLEPQKMIPSGSCNFSLIDNAVLFLSVNKFCFCDKEVNEYINVRVYAKNFNILRIMSGMGSLAYTN